MSYQIERINSVGQISKSPMDPPLPSMPKGRCSRAEERSMRILPGPIMDPIAFPLHLNVREDLCPTPIQEGTGGSKAASPPPLSRGFKVIVTPIKRGAVGGHRINTLPIYELGGTQAHSI